MIKGKKKKFQISSGWSLKEEGKLEIKYAFHYLVRNDNIEARISLESSLL